jgi:hypothetical protein
VRDAPHRACLGGSWDLSLQSPSAIPAPHRACLGGSWDLFTTEPQRPPRSPPSLPRWKLGSFTTERGTGGAGRTRGGGAPFSAPILATTEASSVACRRGVGNVRCEHRVVHRSWPPPRQARVGCRCWKGVGSQGVGESVWVVHRSWLPPRQARRGARDVKA